VDDPVQPLQLGRIGENDFTKPVPVKAAVRPEQALAEFGEDSGQAGGSRLNNLPGDRIGVDDQRTLRGEPPGNLALTRAYTAGQPHAQH
jgi:hypothetical protein